MDSLLLTVRWLVGASISIFAILQPAPLGCLAFVAIDDTKEELVNFTSPNAESLPGAQVFVKDGLDPAKDHTIRLRYAFQERYQLMGSSLEIR